MKFPLLWLLGATVFACGSDRHLTSDPSPAASPSSSSSPRPASSASSTPVASSPATVLDARFIDAVRAAGAAFTAWGRVDERPNVAPLLCDMPRPADHGVASTVRLSSDPDSPHGRKLYYLWASDRTGYLGQADASPPTALAAGFTIVKQSFHAEPARSPGTSAPPASDPPAGKSPAPIRTLREGDRWLETGAPTGLYLMIKVGAPDTPGTDTGWIYGTIAPDGSVTSAGRVSTCMGCHEDAPHERLFGLQHPPTSPAAR